MVPLLVLRNLDPAAGRLAALDEDSQETFRRTLEHFCRDYMSVAQVMA